MPSVALERQVNKEIAGAGLAGCVDYEALQKLAELVEQHGRLEAVGEVLREVQRGVYDGKQPLASLGQSTISESLFGQLFHAGRSLFCAAERTSANTIALADVEAAITQLRDGGPSRDDVAVISAFDIPKISYDPVSSKMYEDKAPRILFPGAKVCPTLGLAKKHANFQLPKAMRCNASVFTSHPQTLQAKHSLYLDRLQLIQQRMKRNMRFQQSTQLFARHGDNSTAQVSRQQLRMVTAVHVVQRTKMPGKRNTAISRLLPQHAIHMQHSVQPNS
jgi:hypothetical protein